MRRLALLFACLAVLASCAQAPKTPTKKIITYRKARLANDDILYVNSPEAYQTLSPGKGSKTAGKAVDTAADIAVEAIPIVLEVLTTGAASTSDSQILDKLK